MESRLERYQNHRFRKKQKRIRSIIIIFAFLILITGMNIVDNSVRNMMCIYDKQLYLFSYDDTLYKLHLFGNDYIVEKKGIDDKIYKVRTMTEDVIKLADSYLDSVLKKIKTR